MNPGMPMGPFAVPGAWLAGAHLAKVVSVQDPQSLSRVQVTLHGPDADGEAPIWARVAVPFAGDNRGAFLIPDVGDEVLVVFAGNDVRHPIVIGTLWNGATAVPEQIGGDRVDRWTITGKAGTRIAIVEAGSGQEKVEIETPNGARATLTDASGGSIKLEVGTHTLTMDNQGVSIQTSGKFSVTASQIEMTAGQMKADTALANFSGVVKGSVFQGPSVVGSTYTPGAGNVW
ncbi:MAG: phage baseplate assembly protein V [Acetobacteraceae bacterium]